MVVCSNFPLYPKGITLTKESENPFHMYFSNAFPHNTKNLHFAVCHVDHNNYCIEGH